MSAISFHSLIAGLLELVKRLWPMRGKLSNGPGKRPSMPPQVGTPRHRHSAFLELP